MAKTLWELNFQNKKNNWVDSKGYLTSSIDKLKGIVKNILGNNLPETDTIVSVTETENPEKDINEANKTNKDNTNVIQRIKDKIEKNDMPKEYVEAWKNGWIAPANYKILENIKNSTEYSHLIIKEVVEHSQEEYMDILKQATKIFEKWLQKEYVANIEEQFENKKIEEV